MRTIKQQRGAAIATGKALGAHLLASRRRRYERQDTRTTDTVHTILIRD
jgi:hypothetical protein